MNPTAIDNGQRVLVTSTLFTGEVMAGLRATPDGGEYSVPGAVPLGQQALAGTVDGRRVRVLGARPSAVDKAMMVVTFAWDDGE